MTVQSARGRGHKVPRAAHRAARLALAGAATTALFAVVTPPTEAHAAGLYFSDRGVRPLGRAGAFVAGADDLGAVWYNPAGLSDAGNTILVDVSWLNFASEYTRRTQVSDANGTQRVYDSPKVTGKTPIIPIPTLAGAYAFGDRKQFVVALSLIAPYTAIASYPLTIGNGQPSPSRYNLVSLDGSLLVLPALQLAWKPIEQVRLGIGVNAVAGSFATSVVFSASPPNRLISAPEDPAYDAYSKLKVGPIFAPSANAGAIFVPDKHVRIGISGQLPFHISAPATIDVRLPTASPFDNATQEGKDANVQFNLPGIFRAGIEVRPIEELRIEVAYVREFWTTHHSIDITPKNIQLVGVTGFPSPFAVSPISIARQFDNSNSYRLGGEYHIKIKDYAIDARAGIAYEQSAIPNAYLSPLTIDLNKVTATIGGSLYVGPHWRFDAVFAHVFSGDATVTPQEAAVPRVNPVKGNPTDTEPVNGGLYHAYANVVGVGLQYKF